MTNNKSARKTSDSAIAAGRSIVIASLPALAARQARFVRGSITRVDGRVVEPAKLLLRLEYWLDSATQQSSDNDPARIIKLPLLQEYRRILRHRRTLLEQALDAAQQLPVTMTGWHSQLDHDGHLTERCRHLAKPLLGPAGLCLHAWLGSAVRAMALALDLPHVKSSLDERYAVKAYRLNLINENYYTGDNVGYSLAGAVCAESIDFLLNTVAIRRSARTEMSTRSNRSLHRKAVEACFSELFDLCDNLALLRRRSLISCANDYKRHHRRWRARRLLNAYLLQHPADIQVNCIAAHLLPKTITSTRQFELLRTAVTGNPYDAVLQHRTGLALLSRLELPEAIKALSMATDLEPDIPQFQDDLARALGLSRTVLEARQHHQMPAITLDAFELKNQTFRPETLATLTRFFHEYGTLAVTNAFDCTLLENCRNQFLQEYRDYLSDDVPDDALKIGDRRFQVSLALNGVFNNQAFYANPFVLTLMQHLLGEQAIVGSMVCATSLPGARNQHVHKDHRALFTRHVNDDPIRLPPAAITTMIPLVPLDETIGTTKVKKGSHRLSRRDSEKLPYQAPILPLGAFFLMDLSLSHKGQGNKTDTVRPIVNMVYQQKWFVDNKNFHRQPALQIPPTEFKKIPKAHRPLFAWATQPGPLVNR